jgi:DNA-directed RNA polymerase specialized sigma24 family protein
MQALETDRGAVPSRPWLNREPGADLVALYDALQILSAMDPRRGRVVALRFFGGLSLEERAEVLKVSAETVMHDWKLAKAWLLRELGGSAAVQTGVS